MSLEPNKKMEELLKRYAGQRKADSPGDFELHPATRNLLQGEVARTFAKTDRAKKKASIFTLWPRLAIIGTFTALLVATVMTLNRPRQTIQIAQNSPKELATPAQSTIEKPKVLGDASSFLKREESAVSLDATQPLADTEIAGYGNASDRFQETETSARSRQLIPARRFGYTLTNDSAIGHFSTQTFATTVTNGLTDANRVAVSSPAIAPAAVAQPNLSKQSQADRRFVQQDSRAKYRQNLLSPAPPKILQSFDLIQTGNNIRLLDHDGSIYEGEILPAEQDKLGAKDVQNRKGNSGFAFRAAGTNQQLNRLVVVTGEFAPMNPNPELKENLPAAGGPVQIGKVASSPNVPAGSIHGKVSVGGTNEFEIQAAEIAK